jgi:hypothetical protein
MKGKINPLPNFSRMIFPMTCVLWGGDTTPNTISQRKDGAMQNMSGGAKSGDRILNSVENSVAPVPMPRLTLVELKSHKLGESEVDARHATHQQFYEFACSFVTLKPADDATNMQHWAVEERRDFLNWCLENGILRIENGRLMPGTHAENVARQEGAS